MESLSIPKYDLKGVKGKVHTFKEGCNSTICDHHSKGHCKLDNALKMCECSCHASYGIFRSYDVLRAGKGKIDVGLKNHSTRQITLQKWTAEGEITAANVIPTPLVPKKNRG